MSMAFREKLLKDHFGDRVPDFDEVSEFLRSAKPRVVGSYNADEVSLATGLECCDPSLADQSQAKEADINTIVERFGLTQMLPQPVKLPLSDEYREPMDLQTAMNVVRRAQEAFDQIPGKIRAKFGNNPIAFSEFALDVKNAEALQEMGLLVPREPDRITPVVVTNASDLKSEPKKE